jgi:hypothetical protein
MRDEQRPVATIGERNVQACAMLTGVRILSWAAQSSDPMRRRFSDFGAAGPRGRLG